MDQIDLTKVLQGQTANANFNVRKVENGIIVSFYSGASNKEYVFTGSAEQIMTELAETLPLISGLFKVGA